MRMAHDAQVMPPISSSMSVVAVMGVVTIRVRSGAR